MEYAAAQRKGSPPSIPAADDAFALDHFLLDSRPDAEISSEMRNLTILIQQHVEDNYHLRPVAQSTGVLARELQNLGLSEEGTFAASRLASLSVDPRTRYAALRHILSRVIFDSTTLGGSAISLLPAAVPAFMKEMPPVEQHTGNAEGKWPRKCRIRRLSYMY